MGAEWELRSAADKGDANKVKVLLDKGVKVDAADEWGSTPLYFACRNGHAEVAKLLLSRGANVNFALKDGWTLLHSAVNQGNEELVEILLKAGATASAQDHKGKTPLMVAKQQENAKIVKMLEDANSWWKVVEKMTGATSSLFTSASSDSTTPADANSKSKKKQFKTRAELDAEIQKCQKLVDIASTDFREEAIERGLQAEERLKTLLPLQKDYPSEAELQNEIDEIESQMIEPSLPLKERLVLAKRLKKVKELHETESKARQILVEPREILESSDKLWQAWKTCKLSELSLSYIKYRINNLSSRLGGGGFANVYLALDAQHSIRFVIKRYNKDHLVRTNDGQVDRTEIIRQVELMSQLQHDNLVRVLGYCFPENDASALCIVYEYASDGSLASILANHKQTLDWRKRVEVACSVASALKYLHSLHYSHREVKPDNICFTQDGRVLLTGWSLSKLVNDDTYADTCSELQCWSDPYVAPEYKNKTLKDSLGKVAFEERCDVYSFGFVLQALITGRLALVTDTPSTEAEMTECADKDAGEWNVDVLQALSSLGASCMAMDRSSRPDFDAVLDVLIPSKSKSMGEATPTQKAVIQSSSEESRYNHGWKNVTRDEGKCTFCLRETDPGLACNRNSNPHFCCNRCFAEHVKKCFSNTDISCRDSSCVSDPFTESQLAENVEPVLLAQHLTAANGKLREEKHKRTMTEQLSRLGSGRCREIYNALQSISKGEAGCPTLFVLSKPRAELGNPCEGSDVKKSPDVKDIYILYFLCAKDQTRINTPIILKRNKAWVENVLPALIVSFFAIRLALLASGELSFADWFEKLGLEGILDETSLVGLISDSVAATLSNLERKLLGMSTVGRDFDGVLREVRELTLEAREEVGKVAKVNPSWRNEMKWSQNAEGGAWVKKKNSEKWGTR